MVNVALSGFPPVVQIAFFQPSGSRPGRCVVDTLYQGAAAFARLPKEASLTITATGFSGVWPDMRVVKSPRGNRMIVRTVLEDSRWKLKTTTMSGSWNKRNILGSVSTATEKTVAELVELIADATGLTIIVGGDVPSFRIPANWSGKTAQQAMSELLTLGGCRMVYQPEEQRYVVSRAGTGAAIPAAARRFRPAPPLKIKDLVIRSGPVLYEDRLPARVSLIDGSGNIVNDNTPILPTAEGFTNHHRLRLWRPTEVEHPEELELDEIELLPHRAATIVPSSGEPVWVPPKVLLEDWEKFPFQRLPLAGSMDSAKVVSSTSGGQAILFDHPILGSDGLGGFAIEGKLLTSYYVLEDDGTYKRNVTQTTIDANADNDMVLTFDWIRPVNSTEPDVGAGEWSALQTAVMNSIAGRYQVDPQTVTLASPVALGGSGHVGATYFYGSLLRRTSNFTVAVNFDPKTYVGSKLR